MANFRNGNLVVGQTLGASTMTVVLTSNNQIVNPLKNQVIKLYSDSDDAALRRFLIQSGTIIGQQVVIIFESASPLICELLYTPGIGNVRITKIWQPTQYDAISLSWDGTFWIEIGRSNTGGGEEFNPVIVNPVDGQVLLYNDSLGQWDNVGFSGAFTNDVNGTATLEAGVVIDSNVSATAALAYSKLAALPSAQVLVGSVGNVATAVDMTGDVTISNTGVTDITAGVIVDPDISVSAAISYSKLAALMSGQVIVGTALNTAAPVDMTGDVTISNTGVTDITAGVIVDADVSASAALAYSKLAALPSAQVLVGSVGNVATAVDMTGDVTISNTGVTDITAGVIVDADVSASAAVAYSKLAALPSAQVLVGSVGNVATAVDMTGDITISNAGVTDITAGVIVDPD